MTILFWNSFRFTEKLHGYCSHRPHTQFSLLLTSYDSMAYLSQLTNHYGYIFIYGSPYFHQIWNFYLMLFFSVPGSPPGDHMTSNSQISLGSSWLREFLTLLLFNDLDSFEYDCPVILQNISQTPIERHSTKSFYSCFTHNQAGRMCFGDENHSKVPHCTKDSHYQHDL